MKKRLFYGLLAAILLASAMSWTAPKAHAAANQGFQALADYAVQYGTEYMSGEYEYGTSKSLQEAQAEQEDYLFSLCYSSGYHTIEIIESYQSGYAAWYNLHLTLLPDGTIENVYLSNPAGEAGYQIDPASFLLTTQLTASSCSSEEPQARLDKFASTLLKETLENLHVILQKSGKTVAALGFTAYTAGHSHSWENGKVDEAPSCTYGIKSLTCSACGGLRRFTLRPINDHIWGDWEITEPATCMSDGFKIRFCTVCGDQDSETIPMNGIHQYVKNESMSYLPTCVEVGCDYYTCSVCGEIKTVMLPATGKHLWDAGTVELEPTCTESGELVHHCETCLELLVEELPALGHAWTLTEVLTEGEEGLHACTGLYTCSRCAETKEAKLCAAEVFTDMPKEGSWAHDPIDWAYFNHITTGKTPTTFAPKATVTRAEAMTFLWTAVGSPEPGTGENPFEDVTPSKYYYKPVLWALENGVTTGKTPTAFGPKEKCTRAQIMTFLWNAAGQPEPETEENPFEDVKDSKYYYKAVLWAVENGVATGTTATTFGPNATCTRAQIVTFLYKAQDLLNPAPEPVPAPDPDAPRGG